MVPYMVPQEGPRSMCNPFDFNCEICVSGFRESLKRRETEWERGGKSGKRIGWSAACDMARDLSPEGERRRLLVRVLSDCAPPAHADDCLEWIGPANKKGYGRVKVDGRLASPHRVAAYAAGVVKRIWEPGRKECVLHRCDNPRCCNPKHLWPGTLSDNMQDCAAKGRLGFQK